ncbi:hypothetical protein GCM10022408_32510 [Hymenobacter fastidiosus]|uniref:Reverse transcriptase domain-containing protein n=2 Tax=Hymenobacter fastidiosus TaxID=486264 RepID=A0ABP7SUB0_9BACT
MPHPALTLNLRLAWERMRNEVPDRAFVRCMHELELIKLNLGGWLDDIDNKLKTGTYVFGNMSICNVPKGRYLVRPGSILTLEDTLVYYGLVGSAFEKIYDLIGWSQDRVDYSYRLNGAQQKSEWILNRFKGWENFRVKSVAKLQKYSHVVVADIAGYYENIDLSILGSQLRSLGISAGECDLLSRALNRWASTSGRGLPQGCIPSDILAKVYMDPIDKALANMGYDHYRYVDDIRIFCDSEQEAKKAVIALTVLLREKGLSLQSAKTKIYHKHDAVKKIEAIQPIIIDIINKLKKDPVELLLANGSVDDSSQDVEEDEEDINKVHIRIIKEAFDTFFTKGDYPFDKSLFRFLMKRLYQEKDDHAAHYCDFVFLMHPEEMHTVLTYLTEVDYGNSLSLIEEFLCSNNSVYEYQNYQLVEWLNNRSIIPTARLLARVRQLAFDSSSPEYLSAVTTEFVGRHGNAADLDRLEQMCKASNGLVQTKLMCTLARLEKSRRNGLFRRLEDAFFHNKSVIAYVANMDNLTLKVKRKK